MDVLKDIFNESLVGSQQISDAAEEQLASVQNLTASIKDFQRLTQIVKQLVQEIN